MDADLSPELQAFAHEVRQFVQDKLPAPVRQRVLTGHPLSRADQKAWQDVLAERGWLAGAWPREYGGCDWTALQSYIFQSESAAAGAPWVLPFGVNMVGPVIFTYGTEAQKQTHLPGIVSNQVFWCQGYSEPESGSDLASLKTRAVRDGEDYVVNGSKLWTSYAHWADWIFALVRTETDVRAQAGISFLLIDLRTSGISVEPVITIDGGHHVNQVFFKDVRVPLANRVGEENKGWTYAKFLLGQERLLSADVGKTRRFLAALRAIGAGQSLDDDPRFLDQYHRLESDVMALEWTTLRMLDAATQRGTAGPEVAVLKVRGSEVQQQISELIVDVLGTDALPFDPAWINPDDPAPSPSFAPHAGMVSEFLFERSLSIFGGSNEIQRNIIAKHALGL